MLIPLMTFIKFLFGLAKITAVINSRLFVLEIVVKNDGSTLFILAIITFLCCLILVYKKRSKIPDLLKLKI